jgi:hypothetical protein
VRRDPVRYHWCFYGKLFALENELKNEAYLDERQKKVIETFGFLVPVAKAFASEYHDSRYLRWSVSRYQKFSETIFYRKLDLTPHGTLELVQPANPFGLWRNSTSKSSIIEKYHIDGSSREEPSILPSTASTPAAVAPISDPSLLPVELPAAETPVPTPSATLSVPSPRSTSR